MVGRRSDQAALEGGRRVQLGTLATRPIGGCVRVDRGGGAARCDWNFTGQGDGRVRGRLRRRVVDLAFAKGCHAEFSRIGLGSGWGSVGASRLGATQWV